jgi:hypothetical protein
MQNSECCSRGWVRAIGMCPKSSCLSASVHIGNESKFRMAPGLRRSFHNRTVMEKWPTNHPEHTRFPVQGSMSALAIYHSLTRTLAGIGRSRNRTRLSYRLRRAAASVNRAVGRRFCEPSQDLRLTRNLRARFGVPSPCDQVTFRTEKGCADESTIGSQKRFKDGIAYHYGVRSSLPIC